MGEINKGNATVQKTEKSKSTILISEHPVFAGGTKSVLMNTVEAAELISQLFGSVFSDYYGCKVVLQTGAPSPQSSVGTMNTVPAGALYVNLYFKDMGKPTDGRLKVLINREEARKADSAKKDGNASSAPVNDSKTANNNMLARMAPITRSAGARVYDVSQETYEILSDFMFRPNVRWTDHTSEITSPLTAYNSKEEVVVRVSGLCMDAIIPTIFGRKVDGIGFEYEITPVTFVSNMRDEILLRISQMEWATVEKMKASLGLANQMSQDFHIWSGR